MRHVTLFLVLTLLVFTGCAGDDVSVTSPQATVMPTNDAPVTSGIITRGEATIGLAFFDVEAGRTAIVGVDVRDFCLGAGEFDIMTWQDMDIPRYADRVVSIAQADDVTISVWPFAGFDCARFFTEEPIGVGTCSGTITDNDLYAFLYDAPAVNAYGYMFHGMIMNEVGRSYPVSVVQRLRWDGEDPSTSTDFTNVKVGGYRY